MIYTDDNIHYALEKVAGSRMNWVGGKARNIKEWIASLMRRGPKKPGTKMVHQPAPPPAAPTAEKAVEGALEAAPKSKKHLAYYAAGAGAGGLGAYGGYRYLTKEKGKTKKSSVNVHEALEKISNVNRFKMYLRMVRNPQRAAKMAYPGKDSSWIKRFLKRLGY